MQKILIIVIAVLLICGGIFVGFMLLVPASSPSTPTQTNPAGTTNGNGNNSISVTPTGVTGGSLQVQKNTITAEDGTTIEVKDFKADPSTIVDSNNPGHYYLSGGLDPTKDESPYSIFYVESDQSFNITLLKEPLADFRKLAEQDLLQKLGISEQQACIIRYWVGVPRWINEKYIGTNLGFSFCPGATVL